MKLIMENTVCLITNRLLTSNKLFSIMGVYLVRSIMENKLAVLLEVLLADRPLSDEMMELVDEAVDYCIEKRYL